MGETDMCFLHIYLSMRTEPHNLQSSQFFAFVFYFLDVHVRFISQSELTNIWSSNNKQ